MGYDNLKLEKGLYQEAVKEGKTFAQKLEELDPTANYEGEKGLGDLDAFQRQLKRFDIKVKGAKSDVVEKFFTTNDSSVLFPEFISRTVRIALEKESILPKLIATTTQIDSDTYKSIYMDTDVSQKQLRRVSEGSKFPVVTLKTKEQEVNVFKFGVEMDTTYEAIRRKKIDIFAIALRQIASQIAVDQMQELINVLINGDGNNNAALSYTVGDATIKGTAGTIGYAEMVRFWATMKNPYKMNALLANTNGIVDLLLIPEFKDPQAGFDFQKKGQLITPLGIGMDIADEVPAGKIIGIDTRYAIEKVEEMGVTVESDKLIDRQISRTVISQVSGFAKLFKESVNVLNKG